MSSLVDPREAAGLPISPGIPGGEVGSAAHVAPIGLDLEKDPGNNLPADHPGWSKDVLSLSARFRAMMEHIKPVVIRALTFWDHRIRSIMISGRKMAVDASGCYRME